MGATIETKWKRSHKGGYRAQVTLLLPLKEYDIRRRYEYRKGIEIKRCPFEGSEFTSTTRPPNRRVPFSRGAEVGLDIGKAYLELRWERKAEDGYDWFCHYELIVPRLKGGTVRTALGGTRRGGDREPLWDGKVDTPFRDGAHAQWDAETLGLKAWAVYGEMRSDVTTKGVEAS
jgi:hypothetical protein